MAGGITEYYIGLVSLRSVTTKCRYDCLGCIAAACDCVVTVSHG